MGQDIYVLSISARVSANHDILLAVHLEDTICFYFITNNRPGTLTRNFQVVDMVLCWFKEVNLVNKKQKKNTVLRRTNQCQLKSEQRKSILRITVSMI